MKINIPKWFRLFVMNLRETLQRDDWPDVKSEYWMAMFGAFKAHHVEPDEADEAAHRIAWTPPDWRKDIIPKLVEMVEVIRVERRDAALSAVCDDLRTIESRSMSCGCSGTGIAERWPPVGDRVSTVSVRYFCVCPKGRWLKASHEGIHESDRLLRLPDLAAFPHLINAYDLPPGSERYAAPPDVRKLSQIWSSWKTVAAELDTERTGVGDTLDETGLLEALSEAGRQSYQKMSEAARCDVLRDCRIGQARRAVAYIEARVPFVPRPLAASAPAAASHSAPPPSADQIPY